MSEQSQEGRQVDRFVLDYIDTVPHLEALLLLWRSRPRDWAVSELAQALYLKERQAANIAQDLMREGLIKPAGDRLQYRSDDADQDVLMAAVDATYRRETVRLSTLIHSRASRAVRDFAQSFRLKKEET